MGPAGRPPRRGELRSADSERPADQGLRENRWRCPRNARALTNRSGASLTVALTRTLGNMVHQNPRVLVDQFATTLRTIRFTTFRKAFVNFWGRSKGLGPQTSFKIWHNSDCCPQHIAWLSLRSSAVAHVQPPQNRAPSSEGKSPDF